ncbi:hypothetical protein NMY22_g7783 [Coprinellus aureogranulatus]|nr:hypothetical protein NMY22_g7783 [Coprinellus aureogranulatus]
MYPIGEGYHMEMLIAIGKYAWSLVRRKVPLLDGIPDAVELSRFRTSRTTTDSLLSGIHGRAIRKMKPLSGVLYFADT